MAQDNHEHAEAVRKKFTDASLPAPGSKPGTKR
jgi:hypothetical protein